MAIWTKELTWQYGVNLATASTGTISNDAKQILVNIMTTLLAFATKPTVWKCAIGDATPPSDSLRWDNVSKIVPAAAGANHSWIVLTFAAGWQLLIDLNNAGGAQYMQMSISPGSLYTGGTATNAPTATDAFDVYTAGSNWYNPGASLNAKTQIWADTGGYNFHMITFCSGAVKGQWYLATLADPVPTSVAWTVPIVAAAYPAATPTWAQLGNVWKTRWNSTNYTSCFLTAEYGYGQTWVPQIASGVPNDTCSAYAGAPVGFGSATVGFRGKQGRFRDLWLGSQAIAIADTYPVAQPDFVQVGEFIFPWDGSTTMLTT